jgi:hypothetical protein
MRPDGAYAVQDDEKFRCLFFFTGRQRLAQNIVTINLKKCRNYDENCTDVILNTNLFTELRNMFTLLLINDDINWQAAESNFSFITKGKGKAVAVLN